MRSRLGSRGRASPCMDGVHTHSHSARKFASVARCCTYTFFQRTALRDPDPSMLEARAIRLIPVARAGPRGHTTPVLLRWCAGGGARPREGQGRARARARPARARAARAVRAGWAQPKAFYGIIFFWYRKARAASRTRTSVYESAPSPERPEHQTHSRQRPRVYPNYSSNANNAGRTRRRVDHCTLYSPRKVGSAGPVM